MIENTQPGDGGRDQVEVGIAKAGPAVVHLQRKTNGETEARFTVRPPDLQRDVTASQTREASPADPSSTDVAVLPDEPSVWEARPVDET